MFIDPYQNATLVSTMLRPSAGEEWGKRHEGAWNRALLGGSSGGVAARHGRAAIRDARGWRSQQSVAGVRGVRTAKALDLTIPPAMLALATQVIELNRR